MDRSQRITEKHVGRTPLLKGLPDYVLTLPRRITERELGEVTWRLCLACFQHLIWQVPFQLRPKKVHGEESLDIPGNA
jgi:hypothetical protein